MAHDEDWFEGRSWSLFHPDEKALERCYWRRIGALLWLLVVVIAIFSLAGCATPPQASKSAYDGPAMLLADGQGNFIRLKKDPCPNVSGWLAMAMAEMTYQGKPYKACWMLVGSTVLVLDSNGDATTIPMQAFKPEAPL